jgi:tetratricopeptide (TPR) repeat protein
MRKVPLSLLPAAAILALLGAPASLRADEAADAIAKGNLAYQSGKFDEAIADYGDALRLNPNDAVTYGARGTAYARKGDFDKAIADFTDFIRLDPDFVGAYVQRGLAYDGKGDYARAIADYDRALRIDPDRTEAYADRGLTHEKMGEHTKALADCRDAIRLNPDYLPFFYRQAAAAVRKGDFEKAISDLNDVIRLRPRFFGAYNDLAWILATCSKGNLRNGPGAVEKAQKACTLTKWNVPTCMDTLAAACAEAGRFDEAVKWETKFLDSRLSNEVADKARQRLSLYKQGKPYHEEPADPRT